VDEAHGPLFLATTSGRPSELAGLQKMAAAASARAILSTGPAKLGAGCLTREGQ